MQNLGLPPEVLETIANQVDFVTLMGLGLSCRTLHFALGHSTLQPRPDEPQVKEFDSWVHVYVQMKAVRLVDTWRGPKTSLTSRTDFGPALRQQLVVGQFLLTAKQAISTLMQSVYLRSPKAQKEPIYRTAATSALLARTPTEVLQHEAQLRHGIRYFLKRLNSVPFDAPNTLKSPDTRTFFTFLNIGSKMEVNRYEESITDETVSWHFLSRSFLHITFVSWQEHLQSGASGCYSSAIQITQEDALSRIERHIAQEETLQ